MTRNGRLFKKTVCKILDTFNLGGNWDIGFQEKKDNEHTAWIGFSSADHGATFGWSALKTKLSKDEVFACAWHEIGHFISAGLFDAAQERHTTDAAIRAEFEGIAVTMENVGKRVDLTGRKHARSTECLRHTEPGEAGEGTEVAGGREGAVRQAGDETKQAVV